jgi:hypothetical protein
MIAANDRMIVGSAPNKNRFEQNIVGSELIIVGSELIIVGSDRMIVGSDRCQAR